MIPALFAEDDEPEFEAPSGKYVVRITWDGGNPVPATYYISKYNPAADRPFGFCVGLKLALVFVEGAEGVAEHARRYNMTPGARGYDERFKAIEAVPV